MNVRTIRREPEQRCASWHGQGVDTGAENAKGRVMRPSVPHSPTMVQFRCCMDGMEIDEDSDVLGSDSEAIRDLCAAEEVAGDVHGNSRLGGFFLLECVVSGRVAGVACAKYMLGDKVKPTLLAELSDGRLSEKVEVFKLANGSCEDTIVSNFLSQHPGGESAILTVAGKDAFSEFDMIHLLDVIENYAPDAVIGVIGLAVTASIPAAGVSAAALVAASASGGSRAKECASDRIVEHGKVSLCTIGPFIYMVLNFMKKTI